MVVILKDSVKNIIGIFEMKPGFFVHSHVTYKETLYALDHINHKKDIMEYVESPLIAAPDVEDHMIGPIEEIYYAS